MEDPVNRLFFVRWNIKGSGRLSRNFAEFKHHAVADGKITVLRIEVDGFPKALILKARFPILTPNEIQFHPQRRIKISLEARVGAISKIDQGVRPIPNAFKLVMQGIRIGS